MAAPFDLERHRLTGSPVGLVDGVMTAWNAPSLPLDKGALWVINSDDRAIFKIDTKDGAVLSKIQLSKDDPVPHGLDMDRNGVLWYCDAGTGWICKLS